MLIFTGVILLVLLCVSVLAFIIPPTFVYNKDIVLQIHKPIAMLDIESVWAINKELNNYGKLCKR